MLVKFVKNVVAKTLLWDENGNGQGDGPEHVFDVGDVLECEHGDSGDSSTHHDLITARTWYYVPNGSYEVLK